MVCKVDCFADVFAKFLQGLVRYPCPFAEQHHCTTTFSSKASANRHKSKHSGIRYLVHWQNSIIVHGHSHARTLLGTTKKRTLSPTSVILAH